MRERARTRRRCGEQKREKDPAEDRRESERNGQDDRFKAFGDRRGGVGTLPAAIVDGKCGVDEARPREDEQEGEHASVNETDGADRFF